MAARSLVEHGHDVRVFEKSRAPSGRSATRRDGEYEFDHGAQYFTQRDDRLVPLMQRWQDSGLIAPWTATIAARDNDVWSLKADTQTRWVAVPGMRALGMHLASTLQVQYGATVTSLERHDYHWQLVTNTDHSPVAFDRVLVTAPAPQTQALLAPHSQQIASQAAAVQMQPCIATMLVLERRPDVEWDAAFVNDHAVLSWVARNNSKPQRGHTECWVLHATPSWSAVHLEREPQELASLMTHAFAELVQHELPLVQSVAHRWRYAIPVGGPLPQRNHTSASSESEALYDAECGLGAAGDWCVGGRVEGALLSGMALAELVSQDS